MAGGRRPVHPSAVGRVTANNPNPTITAIPGVTVGHWTEPGRTGCTVVRFPAGNTAVAEVRGAAPGTRETALLAPGMTVASCDAIVLTGGSAFGLAAADGVMAALRAQEVGFETSGGVVPIVPAAVIFDLVEDADLVHPTAESGASALAACSDAPVAMGLVGAGTGATVSKWRDARQSGGLGSAIATVGDVTVGALAVVNAAGDLFSLTGEALTGGPHLPDAPVLATEGENTTLVVLATSTPFTAGQLGRLVVRAHDAMGACIRPVHTRVDGDVCFAVSCPPAGESETTNPSADPADVDAAGEAAFAAVAYAIAASLTRPGA